jgi:diguanylate cyclase (GGDEF)-like protein/PAS domain S-box-containing protein
VQDGYALEARVGGNTTTKGATLEGFAQGDILEHVLDAVVVTDADFQITAWNRAAETLYGWRADEVIGRSTYEVIPVSYLNTSPEEVVTEFRAQGKWRGEVVQRTRYGKERFILASVSVIQNAQGQPVGVVAVNRDISDFKEAQHALELVNQELARSASFDALTNLPNRRFFEENFETMSWQRRKGDERLYLAYLDLDNFKTINDTFGHQEGDRVLVQVARQLRTSLRDQDMVARVGGDEFLMLLEGEHDRKIRGLFQRVQEVLQTPVRVANQTVAVNASIGVACFGRDGTSYAALLRAADQAMYGAKNQGGGISFYTPGLNQQLLERSAFEAELRNALTHNALTPYYQPIFSVKHNKPVFYEALVRWHHPERGLLSPDTFIPLAEETGLIEEIDRWMLSTSLQNAVRHRIAVSVNMSPTTIQNSSLVRFVEKHLETTQLAPQQLQIEITEQVLAEPDKTLPTLEGLRALGVRIALDDFGMGYSSLAYLNTYPLDVLKIDRHFVTHLQSERTTQTVCEFIIRLAHELNLVTVAEGVELEPQLTWLGGVGCDLVQGFFLQPPRTLDALLTNP